MAERRPSGPVADEPRGVKRPREGRNASTKVAKPKLNGPALETAESQFSKGAIVRLRLHHFL